MNFASVIWAESRNPVLFSDIHSKYYSESTLNVKGCVLNKTCDYVVMQIYTYLVHHVQLVLFFLCYFMDCLYICVLYLTI